MIMAIYIPNTGGVIDPVIGICVLCVCVLSVGAWVYMCLKDEVTR